MTWSAVLCSRSCSSPWEEDHTQNISAGGCSTKQSFLILLLSSCRVRPYLPHGGDPIYYIANGYMLFIMPKRSSRWHASFLNARRNHGHFHMVWIAFRNNIRSGESSGIAHAPSRFLTIYVHLLQLLCLSDTQISTRSFTVTH